MADCARIARYRNTRCDWSAVIHGSLSSTSRLIAFLLATALVGDWCSPAGAQAARPATPEMTESCPGLVAGVAPRGVPAAYRRVALTSDQVRATYLGHSTFLIESPRLVRIATDYN